MATTTATILCENVDSTTTLCVMTQDFVSPLITYGDVLIAFFLFLLMLGMTFGFMAKHFIRQFYK